MAGLPGIPRPADPFEKLNAQQRAAVRHGDGPLLVVAGAGTGKTRVITERIRYLLEANPELSGENILGLTFTEKAAAEMKRRIAGAVGERGQQVWLGTFHSFCQALLEEKNPNLRVLDPVDHWILLRRHLPDLGLDRFRRLAEPGQFLGDFIEFFSRCQDELVSPDDYQRYADALAERYRRERDQLSPEEQREWEERIAREQEVARVYRTSDRLLREGGMITFGGQLFGAVEQLRSDAAWRTEFQRRYRYVLVDEFQDTNIAQLELLWLLADAHRNVVAVGDDDQAIYRFRGASFGSFTLFLEKMAGARVGARAPARHIQPLTINYRSTGRILRVAGQVIAQNEKSPILPKKDLTPQKPEGERIRVVELGAPEEEARWIATELERLHSEGHRWNSFAVLFRKHVHRNRLVPTLVARGIPFIIKNLSILNHPVVRDAITYLRLIASPGDNVACARVLAAPGWGLAATDLVRLCERAAKVRGMSLWDALERFREEPAFSECRTQTGELVRLISKLRQRAAQEPVGELLSALAEALEVRVTLVGNDRKYLDRFAEFVAEWENKSTTKRLTEFMEYLDFFQQAGGQINLEEENAGDAVQLMTVHAAKGLEFDHVFVMRLSRGDFPVNPRPRVLEFPDELMKEEKPKGDFHIQEERRLFYVALTRARERLTLTTVVNHRTRPSLFLEDILQAAEVKRRDVQQLAPKLSPQPATEKTAPPERTSGSALLFDPSRSHARLYSQVGRWAEDYCPPLAEPLRLSASSIETYRSCPKKFLFQRLWGLREGPQAATSFGSVMHNTIRQFIAELKRGRRLPFEEVEAIFEREWSSAGFEDPYQEQEYKKDGLEQLRAFHGSMLATPPEVLAQEKSFELPMDDNVVITGRIDQINRAGPRAVEIVDYKTGKPKPESAAKKDLQLSLYALAALEVFDLDPERLVFYNLQSNERVATTRDTRQLDEARATVREVAAEIRAGEFPARPSFFCKSCAFQPLCPAHEQRLSPAAREN